MSTATGFRMSEQQTARWSAKVESVYQNQGRELWALLYAHCCDAETAHDALQEAFVRLQEQNGTPIRDVRAWLLRVGRNWLCDVARRQKVAALGVESLDGVAASPAEPSAILEKQELHGRVRDGLSRLRFDDREVLVLRYALGWNSQRMGDVLNLTSSAIDMRLSRARQRLAEVFEQTGIDHEQI